VGTLTGVRQKKFPASSLHATSRSNLLFCAALREAERLDSMSSSLETEGTASLPDSGFNEQNVITAPFESIPMMCDAGLAVQHEATAIAGQRSAEMLLLGLL